MKVILHIGVHKTGTSALQTFLAANEAMLSEQGVYYKPTNSDWPNHNSMIAGFVPGHSGGPEVLAKLIDAGKGKTLLVSSEMLCEIADIDPFLSCFEGHEVRTIAYVRHPCDIVISAFNEVVRHYPSRWTRPINEPPFAYPPLIDVLKRWIDKTNLTIAPYDRTQWSGGSICSDFLTMIGVDGVSFDYSQGDVNVSLPYPLAEVLRLVNMTEPSADQHREILERLRMIKCEAGLYPLAPHIIETCIEKMREALPILRPIFRPGFHEAFLLQPRP